MKPIAILPFLLSSIVTYSQTKKADSLRLLLPLHSGIERADILYNLAFELVDTNYGLALSYGRNARSAAEDTGDSLRIVKAGKITALAFRRLEMLDSSLILSLRIIPIARRNSFDEELASLLNGVGLLYNFMAQYDYALEYYFESLEIRKRYGDPFDVGVVNNNIGLVYLNLGDFDNALIYFRESARLKIASKFVYDTEIVLNNIALCYIATKKLDSAYLYVNKAFRICGDGCSNDFKVNAYFTLGMAALAKQNLSLAEREFLESYNIAVASSNKRFQLANLAYLMQIYLDTDRIKLAENCFSEAEPLINSNTPYQGEIIDALAKAIKIHQKLGHFELVSFYQVKYIALKDSTYHADLAKNLMRIEAEHIKKESKAKIEAQEKILLLNNEIIVRQKYLNLFIGIVAILLVLLTIILVRINKHKQKLNQLLERKVRERTHELEFNRDALQRSCDERDVLLQKMAADIRSSNATIKGLCNLAKKDVSQVDRYLDEVYAASDNFYTNAGKIINHKLAH